MNWPPNSRDVIDAVALIVLWLLHGMDIRIQVWRAVETQRLLLAKLVADRCREEGHATIGVVLADELDPDWRKL